MEYIIELLDTSNSKLGTWIEVASGNGTLVDIEKALDIARWKGYCRVIIA
jgi:hypothetical protein